MLNRKNLKFLGDLYLNSFLETFLKVENQTEQEVTKFDEYNERIRKFDNCQ